MKDRGPGLTWRAGLRPRPYWLCLSVATLAVVGLCALFSRQGPAARRAPGPSVDRTSAPQSAPLSPSPSQDASPEAAYAGMAACTACHAEQTRTYAQTAHSLALVDVEAASEPPDATFHEDVSGRTYTVYRKADQLRHREAVIDDAGEEIAAADYPVRYAIGSGRHARNYLIEVDGFLCESPLTWYASRKIWGVSPGYDSPNPPGFERPADPSCLFCHVGQLADGFRGYQRVEIVEQSIGCERCHGPGSLHVAEKRGAPRDSGQADGRPAIVNPARLPRKLSEAVCAQCHLDTEAATLVRGRELADFRPGLPLSDFCVNYQASESDSEVSQMTIVGHVEQMRLSRCYKESETLTCTTCHDPHAERLTKPAERQARYIQVCFDCHADRGCRLELDERLRDPAANNCLTCHMPQADTDAPHIAFTHHRVGIHSRRPAPDGPKVGDQPTAAVADLVPLDEPPAMSETDRARNLGLAYFSLSQQQTDRTVAAAYRERARRLLESVRARGEGDGEVAAALARLYFQVDPDAAQRLADEALKSGGLAMKSRITCLFLFGQLGVARGLPSLAEPALAQLTEIRLWSEDWRLLGTCRQRAGDLQGARAALERAVGLAPFRPHLRKSLAEIYQRLGLGQDARRERETADRLVRRTGRGR